MSRRKQIEAEFARRHMPAGTRLLDLDGADVWVFNTKPVGKPFQLGLYYDADMNAYSVQCISPNLEGRWTAKLGHDFHIYSDGRICLSSRTEAHMPTMSEAYGRACLWALGVSLMEQGRAMGYREMAFPF